MRDFESVIPFKLIKLEEEGVHILITAQIGRVNAHLLIDTGASRTVFDEKFIQKILPQRNLEPLSKHSTGVGSSSIQGSIIQIPRLKIGRVKMNNYIAAVIDLSHVNASYASLGIKPIHGVLGGDILYRTGARIDFKTLELIINEPEP